MFRFKNFKNFADVTLDLDRAPVTILIGRNGSGKSNAIEALQLLAHVARGYPLHEIDEPGRGTRLGMRGGLRGALRFGQRDVCLESTDGEARYAVDIRVAVPRGDPSDPGIWRERYDVAGINVYDARRRGAGLLRVNWQAEAAAKSRQINLPANAARLAQLAQVSKDRLSQVVLKATQEVAALCPEPVVLDPVPSLMREYVRRQQRKLHRNASNLSSVLLSLHESRSPTDQQALRHILDGVRSLPESPVSSIEFQKTDSDVLFGFLFGTSTSLVDARLLSDGVLRAVAILTALVTSEPGTLVVVEELDNGLHPSRASELMRTVWELAKAYQIRLLVTTHNPALLNGLDNEQMKGVVLCYNDQYVGASVLKHLTDLPDPEAILRAGHLGEFVVHERYRPQLVPDYAARRAAAINERFSSLTELADLR